MTSADAELKRHIGSGDNADVIRFFMHGMPPEWVEPTLQNPGIVAMAPSLASDSGALAWTQSASRAQLWGAISQPTLVQLGEETLPIMPPAAGEILAAMPNSQLQIIRASGHDWDADVMVEVLASSPDRSELVHLHGPVATGVAVAVDR